MRFEKVIGQSEVKSRLTEMVLHNRLSHALLFLGKEGTGALSLALAFAQYVMCEKVQEQSLTDACGECAACIKASANVHPDLHFSYPVIPKKSGDKPVSADYAAEWRTFIQSNTYGNVYDWLQSINAENRQGNITADECNDIIRKLNLKTFESRYKILVMWMPEFLGKEGNKLLKLIEEPPANTLFLLVAENESLVLPTILSRCQLVKIPAFDDQDIVNALLSQGTPEAQARQLAAVSEGNYRDALNHLHQSGEDWMHLTREWLNAILRNGPIALVKWIDETSKMGREKQKQFLRYFNHLLEQSVRIRVLGENSQWAMGLPTPERDFILRINKMADLSQQEAIVEELDKAAYYIERNANAKMLFHALSIKLFHILRDKARVSAW
ncbi:ATP-binding protein [Flavihumibacter solisilvae]|uniref:DNA polymerase III subunit gamma/tau n=1 Tax=Flavihumibacter solisilvae TaxID=1349421 RepID=A0A0C1L7B8_9BACT|nr:DNA polymerase III subunit gamma/tau [Flavihumibacter solisilvae]KIC96047.1 DNA polymerase III subunit gamma/tau [Flavihumibacter solisilvae]